MIMAQEKTIVAVDCVRCKETQHITVGTADLSTWNNGGLIQDAMPYLSAGEREILISGVCGTCFDNMFGGEE
jgi:hypothetical protein